MMNRIARRASQAQARKNTVDRVTAIHEAGHAVGRLLTAREMGYSPEQAVHSIQIGVGPTFRSADGKVLLLPQAICYGPAVSLPLQRAYQRAYPGCESVRPDELNARILEIGTAKERVASARAKMIIAAMGSAAEARLVGAQWADIALSDACEGDLIDLHRAAKLLGHHHDHLAEAIHASGARAMELVAVAEIWNAIKAIAAKVNAHLSGKTIASVAAPFLEKLSDLSQLDAGVHS
jgi:hypothetical protein